MFRTASDFGVQTNLAFRRFAEPPLSRYLSLSHTPCSLSSLSQGRDGTVTHLLPVILSLLRDETTPDARLAVIARLDAVHAVVGLDLLAQSLLPAVDHEAIDQRLFATAGVVHQEADDAVADPPDPLTEAELRECLQATLENLSELQGSVLHLREREGLELDEICNLLQVSLSNVRVLLHRARLKVFATLEHFEETGQC